MTTDPAQAPAVVEFRRRLLAAGGALTDAADPAVQHASDAHAGALNTAWRAAAKDAVSQKLDAAAWNAACDSAQDAARARLRGPGVLTAGEWCACRNEVVAAQAARRRFHRGICMALQPEQEKRRLLIQRWAREAQGDGRTAEEPPALLVLRVVGDSLRRERAMVAGRHPPGTTTREWAIARLGALGWVARSAADPGAAPLRATPGRNENQAETDPFRIALAWCDSAHDRADLAVDLRVDAERAMRGWCRAHRIDFEALGLGLVTLRGAK